MQTNEEKNLLLAGELLLGRWKVLEKIGEGTFSQIFTAFDITNTALKVAVKVEAPSEMKPVLEWESQVLVALQKRSPYVCKYYHHGKHGDNFILIMELLGDNMSKLRGAPDAAHGVPLSKAVAAGIQMLDCLESFHNAGFLHRDIKASNFALSNGAAASKKYFVIDFGLSKQHLTPDGDVIAAREKAEFRGTSMYASLRAHRREELGRRDDLISWFYLVLDLIRGELPWAYDAQKKNREVVVELKEFYSEMHPEKLVESLPGARHLLKIATYLETELAYGDAPNYSLLRKSLKAVEDKDDEQVLLEEWDAMQSTESRAAAWTERHQLEQLTDETLLKVAKHYGSFFDLSDTDALFALQKHIWTVERRVAKAALAFQTFSERRLREQKRRHEAMLKRRDSDMRVRESMGAAQRLKAQHDAAREAAREAARAARDSPRPARDEAPGTTPAATTPAFATVPTIVHVADKPTDEEGPRRKRSRWDA
ncbi:CK1/TTBK protein kinase [Saprolegnia diclina VS20]|uniref:Casein kinase I n=1 Tax=Saprolegnia diclina (strain VS20) TaxID=1156394 RepID=T0SFB0_SAPDV|nr:CK1/TTBK protein kinase [Saprolegnia diclina VS20]EQC41622.1 CK1/TTBK protein kinase [Saprolegnia diclina VS20]|eukprot:XP_008605336.1 CK1/TTBK protein kinase [Saprolegnia diclina VS20]